MRNSKLFPSKFDCYSRAEPDEPMFVLLARDKHAPALVRSWAYARRAAGEDQAKRRRDGSVARREEEREMTLSIETVEELQADAKTSAKRDHDEGAKEERAKIVKWLRNIGNGETRLRADQIERGEHDK